ncbi:MAG: vWA domain-containing protein [Candidatus Diapherotrites archaeon]
MSNSKHSDKAKGYAFTFEAAMALLVVLGFLGIAAIYPHQKEPYTALIESKELIADMRRALDENGFVINVLDNNFGFEETALKQNAQMDALYAILKKELPANLDLRIRLEKFESNKENCLLDPNKTFTECFPSKIVFPEKGNTIPQGKEIVSTSTFLVKKSPPGQCSVQFADKKTSKKPVLAFFQEKPTIAYFNGSSPDLNIQFTTKFDPDTSEIECDQNIRCDLNAFIPSGGRKKADIVLLLTKSGSLKSNENNKNMGVIKSGSFNGGTYSGNCNNPDANSWQNLYDINIEKFESDLGFQILMSYSGYAGSCGSPRLRLLSPTGTYKPNVNGATGASPITVDPGNNPGAGLWRIQGWSDENINYDLNLVYKGKAKIEDLLKKASKSFINHQMWDANYDQLAMFSFNQDVNTDLKLMVASDANRFLIKKGIDDIVVGGQSETGSALYEGRLELTSSRAQSGSVKAIVLISNMQTEDPQHEPIPEAHICKDNNIVIYSIGFGSSDNLSKMQEMADITGGKYYYLSDFTLLSQVYEDIGYQIGYLLKKQKEAYDVSIRVELPAGARVLDSNGGTFEVDSGKEFLKYSKAHLSTNEEWLNHFIVQYDCNMDTACNTSSFKIPGENSAFYYKDENGISKTPIIWPDKKTIILKFRDLQVAIVNGYLVAVNSLFLDLNAKNTGLLNAGATTIDFYWSPDGATIDPVNKLLTINVPLLDVNAFKLFYDQPLSKEGWIIAVINPNGNIKECPRGNIAKILCHSGTRVEYYKLTAWVWRK